MDTTRSWSGMLSSSPADTTTHACFCIGPQRGEPLCPCMMRNVKIRGGRYVQVIDHGPAPKDAE